MPSLQFFGNRSVVEMLRFVVIFFVFSQLSEAASNRDGRFLGILGYKPAIHFFPISKHWSASLHLNFQRHHEPLVVYSTPYVLTQPYVLGNKFEPSYAAVNSFVPGLAQSDATNGSKTRLKISNVSFSLRFRVFALFGGLPFRRATFNCLRKTRKYMILWRRHGC